MLEGKTVTCLGGTFNRIHAGHRLLFKAAFESADVVAVGVASDSLVRRLRKSRSAEVRPYAQREADVRRLLQGYRAERFMLASLDDPYTPAKREEFDAIVVSPETRKTAEEINALRALRGFADLRIIEVPHVLAFDGRAVSSTRILAGEIDEEGRPPGGRVEVLEKAPAEAPAASQPADAPAPAPPPPPSPEPAPTAVEEPVAPAREPAPVVSAPAETSPAKARTPAPRPRRPAKKARTPSRKPARKKAAGKRRKATGKKAAGKRGKGRSKARKGSRAAGPRSRR